METKAQDGYSVTLPLPSGYYEKQTKLGVEEVEGVPNSVTGTTSFFQTCFNGLNAQSDSALIGFLGYGMLSIPYALSSGGWLSLILLPIIATSAFYTALLMQRCMDADQSIRSYPGIVERAFGTKGRTFASIAMNVELYLIVTSFLIVEGDNLVKIFPDVGIEIGGLRIGGRVCFVIIVGLILLPTVWLKNMIILSYISATGVLASVIILGSILWAGKFDGIGFQERGTLLNWKGLPTAVSLYTFCYSAHEVFPTLYSSMKNQRLFSKVLLLCFFFCTVINASMAIFGYLMFGPKVQSQITLNLPTHKISSKVAIYTTLINPIAKYALMVTPILNFVENPLRSYCNIRHMRFVISTILVISTIIVALTIPFFGYLVSLVGALLSVTISTLLPCLCYLKIFGTHQKLRFELVIIGGIVVIGLFIGIIGTCTSLIQIIKHL